MSTFTVTDVIIVVVDLHKCGNPLGRRQDLFAWQELLMFLSAIK